jgi:hypothetical protein
MSTTTTTVQEALAQAAARAKAHYANLPAVTPAATPIVVPHPIPLPARKNATVLITGNTYPVKDQIKALGGKWDPDAKGWRVSADKEEAAKALVFGATATQTATPGVCRKCGKPCSPKWSTCFACKPAPSKCKQCGARPNNRGWPRIYRNGICSDCYRADREDWGDYSY